MQHLVRGEADEMEILVPSGLGALGFSPASGSSGDQIELLHQIAALGLVDVPGEASLIGPKICCSFGI